MPSRQASTVAGKANSASCIEKVRQARREDCHSLSFNDTILDASSSVFKGLSRMTLDLNSQILFSRIFLVFWYFPFPPPPVVYGNAKRSQHIALCSISKHWKCFVLVLETKREKSGGKIFDYDPDSPFYILILCE